MFKIGDYMIYGSVGVCRVDAIGPLGMEKSENKRLYYTLTPVYESGSKVFTPVDNEKVIMRPILSKREAQELIDTISEVETLWVPFEKGREEIYKEAMKKCDCREWIKVIKTLYQRKQARIAEGKKAVNADEKYLHIAEEALYGELAIPLNMKPGEVEKYIEQKCEIKD